jgi:signal transduction histidine kinase/CHASE2 domain-containing sensor protein/ActR/RegA family two-component response regulator
MKGFTAVLKYRNAHIIVLGVLSTLFFAGLFFIQPDLLKSLDVMNYDGLLKNFPGNSADGSIVIIDIDEKSLNQYGQWPWPRYRTAELLNAIAALAPATVGIDIVFSEPDRTSLKQIRKDLKTVWNFDLSIDGLPGKLADNDQILSDTLARGPFVLGYSFHFNRLEKTSDSCTLHPVNVSLAHQADTQAKVTRVFQSTGILCNLPVFSKQVTASGFCNFSPDNNGVLRRIPLIIAHDNSIYAGLAFATVLNAQKTDHLVLKTADNTLQSIYNKEVTIPVDARGRLLIKYRGPKRQYQYISAADIMAGRIPAEQIQGKTVFVGTTAAGLKDSLTTPFDPTFPGIEVHATIADNLKAGDFIWVPHWSKGLVLLSVLALGGLLTLVVAFTGTPAGITAALAAIAGLWLATRQIFFHTGMFIETAFPMASTAGIFIFLTFVKYREARRQAQTKHKEAQNAVDFERRQLLSILDNLNQLVYVADPFSYEILFANQRLKDLLGKDPTGGYCHKELQGFDAPCEFCTNPIILNNNEQPHMWEHVNQKLKIDLSIVNQIIQWPDGRKVRIEFAEDISEQKQAQNEQARLQTHLNQVQKMEAVGTLAGGVAHDFNNMLGAIMGYAELTIADMDPADPSRKRIYKILETAQRSANLTRQLLTFARKETVTPVVFDLNKSIASLLKMIRRLIGENIELVWEPANESCPVKLDPSQFDQILLNLCVNAKDAIAKKSGRIVIETDVIHSDGLSDESVSELPPGHYVQFAVSDNGSGMDKETLAHIFEPFFTTKGIGYGTGMGLSTVYGIVKQHDGMINVSSEPGTGTTFTLLFPLDTSKLKNVSNPHIETIPKSCGETILIIEDDTPLLKMVILMLKQLDYNVLSADTPSGAIRLVREFGSDIHMFITDVVMPEMNGRDLADRLMAVRPGIKYLFMSGYTADVIAHQGVLDKNVNFIQKPFSLRDLAASIRKVLDAPNPE